MCASCMDHDGVILVHKNIAASAQALPAIIAPYRTDLVIGVECMFAWYWVADLCRQENIVFILGHALYFMLKRKQVFDAQRFLNR